MGTVKLTDVRTIQEGYNTAGVKFIYWCKLGRNLLLPC